MTKTTQPRRPSSKGRKAVILSLAVLLLGAGSIVGYTWLRLHNASAIPVSAAEEDLARSAYLAAGTDSAHPFATAPDLSAFHWEGPAASAQPSAESLAGQLHARSAIVVDAASGEVLFEKNADEPIPPASMTKLVAMYTAFHAAENGEITFDDVVDLPPETWAVNIPSGSSLMFLGEGQRVTVRELLLGMAVASGNDAAIALALHVSGSVESFVERMNKEMARLGLDKTRFVEPSGLSELNMTTAREFADFALVYVRDYPEALRAFHSRTTLEYPQSANLGTGPADSPILQHATNKLLGVLEGCDGLKTGFINESGYNLSLTATRHGDRFLSVTLGGSGSSTAEGSRLRSQDGTALMEWAFGNFTTVKPAPLQGVTLPVFGGTQESLEAIPAVPAAFTAPADIYVGVSGIPGTKVNLPAWIFAPVPAGEVLGTIDYTIGGIVVHSVPMIADRGIAQAGLPALLLDETARMIAPLIK